MGEGISITRKDLAQFEIVACATDQQTNDLCNLLRSKIIVVARLPVNFDTIGESRLRRIVFACPDSFEVDLEKIEYWLNSLNLGGLPYTIDRTVTLGVEAAI